MSLDESDEHEFELEREVQGCEVRLGLLPPFDGTGRNDAFRQELQDRRAHALRRLADLRSSKRPSESGT